ncbi:hypothetical protein PsAD5_00367 [Pseudovibrio sp. Ad5]|uniref:hypothetical protein n=1 Tax=Pseudovibrio sp. Ad5 TaxID=989436 RepID=UPI0007AEC6D5|nr:hypothetical protein [Pseudovibrio sp. Ad5]KZL01797.1 hypothetical protein PsAD5_00367 [Pseudovibrio sp. Ad5]
MSKRVILGGLAMLTASASVADAGFNQSRAEKFARKNEKHIICYYLYGLTNQSSKQDIARGVITAMAYAKGMKKQEAIYALGYGSGKISAILEADPDHSEDLIQEHSKDCK